MSNSKLRSDTWFLAPCLKSTLNLASSTYSTRFSRTPLIEFLHIENSDFAALVFDTNRIFDRQKIQMNSACSTFGVRNKVQCHSFDLPIKNCLKLCMVFRILLVYLRSRVKYRNFQIPLLANIQSVATVGHRAAHKRHQKFRITFLRKTTCVIERIQSFIVNPTWVESFLDSFCSMTVIYVTS